MYICPAVLFRTWSANTISDVGVEVLAKVLVGEYPGGRENDSGGGGGSQDGNAEDEQLWPGRITAVLKTLDLGQVSKESR